MFLSSVHIFQNTILFKANSYVLDNPSKWKGLHSDSIIMKEFFEKNRRPQKLLAVRGDEKI